MIASRTPAIPLASVARAAKPTTRPSTADEARIPVATRRTESNCQAASASPMITIRAKISRRTSRRRVVATGDSSPPLTRSRDLSAAAGERAVDDLGDHERERPP